MLQKVYLHDELVVTDVPYNDLEKQVDVNGQMLGVELNVFLTQ